MGKENENFGTEQKYSEMLVLELMELKCLHHGIIQPCHTGQRSFLSSDIQYFDVKQCQRDLQLFHFLHYF